MTTHEPTPTITQALLMVAEIRSQLNLFADETTRLQPSRAYLETHAARLLKCAAQLYASTLLPPAPPVPLRSSFEPPLNTAVLHTYEMGN